MSTFNHTDHLTGAALTSSGLNAPLGQLDAAIGLNKYNATAAPTTGDDTGDGYTVGSRWVDVTNDRAYVCVDATLGAAVWKEVSFPASVTQNFSITGVLTVTGTSGDVVVDHLTGDGNAVDLRSTGDVAHGITSLVNTATYLTIKKQHNTDGGAQFAGWSGATRAVVFKGTGTTENSTRSISADAPLYLYGATKSGTSEGGMGADKNILVVANFGQAKFIMDTDGDSFQDVGTAWTNFDTHDDVSLLNMLAAHVTRKGDPLRGGFAKWLKQNRKELERLELVTFNPDGHHFVNMSRLTMLHTGALRQLGARMALLEKHINGPQRIAKTNRKPVNGKATNHRNRQLARGVV